MNLYTYKVVLLNVHDGDTLKLDIDLGFGIWRRNERYRFARINAPELNTPAGVVSQKALADKLATAKEILVQTSKPDNYGRFLVEVIADGVNINDWMVANGFAAIYTGGKIAM